MKIISAIFKTFVLSLLIIGQLHFAYAQTASILPPAKTTFLDQNGKPLTSGKVEFYIPGTSTLKTTWQDGAETIPNTNPVILDAAGRALILGSGSYRQIVKDRNNNVVWDQVTSSTGSGSGGGPAATGDGDLVGTIKPWAGYTAPNQYMFTYGQEVSRTTYSSLFTAIVFTQAVFCSSGSPILTGLSDTNSFWIGMTLEVACLGAGFSTVISKTSSTVTMAANANLTINTNAKFFPWGRGNGVTTFNLPDFRGFVLAGNNIMGGTASSNLNTTYFGAQSPNSAGGSGGNQSIALLRSHLPNVNFTVAAGQTVSVSGTLSRPAGTDGAGATGLGLSGNSIEALTMTSTGTVTNTGTAASGGGGAAASATVAAGGSGYSVGAITLTVTGGTCSIQPTFTATGAAGAITSPVLLDAGYCTVPPSNPASTSGGGGTLGTLTVTYSALPISNIQPTKMANYIIKVTPDANSATASGVTDINGMIGSIGCLSPIICTGNNITSIGIGAGGSNTQVQYNNGGALAGDPCFIWVSPSLTIGLNGSCGGQLKLAGATSGTLTQSVLAAAGAASIVWGVNSGTPVVTATSPLAINTSTGDVSLNVVPIASGGSSQTTALAARSSSGFNIDAATSTGDANYTILSANRHVYHTALSAARTDTLPAANSVNVGQQFVISDFRGVASGSNTITLLRAGADTINGVTSVVAINTQYGAGIFWSDGVSRWTFFPVAAGVGTGTVTNVSTGGILTGGPITTTGTINVNASITPQHRITLFSGVPVLTSTISGSTTVVVTPYVGNLIPIYDGTNLVPTAFPETAQATTDATKSPAAVAASKVYDIFCWLDGATPRCTRGPAWTNATTRGYTLTMTNGILLNTSIITNGPAALRGTWVGTIASNASSTIDYIFGSSASGGTAAVLNVWNAYNRVLTPTTVTDSGTLYTVAVSTRQARASAGNQISFVTGAQEDSVTFSYNVDASTAVTTNSAFAFGVGFNSTSTYGVNPSGISNSTAGVFELSLSNVGVWYAPIGINVLSANEGTIANVSTSNVAGFGGKNTLMATIRN